MQMDGNTRRIVAANIKRLMDQRDWKQAEVGRRAGLGQRTVSNVLRPETGSTTLETLEAIAEAFRIDVWLLFLPDIPLELMQAPSLGKLVDNYVHASPEARRSVDRIAEVEARYSVDPNTKTSSGP